MHGAQWPWGESSQEEMPPPGFGTFRSTGQSGGTGGGRSQSVWGGSGGLFAPGNGIFSAFDASGTARRGNNIFDLTGELTEHRVLSRHGSSEAPSQSSSKSSASRDAGLHKSLENEMKELRNSLLARRRKLRKQESKLGMRTRMDSNVRQQAPFESLDGELARLEQEYALPQDNGVLIDVDELIKRAESLQPLSGLLHAHNSMPGFSHQHQEQKQQQQVQAPGLRHGSSVDTPLYVPEHRREELINLIKNVKGSQRIQKNLARLAKMDSSHPEFEALHEEALELFHGIEGHINKLLQHRSANYAVSKLFEVLDPARRMKFLAEIKNRLGKICRQQHGTFAVQKIISCLTDPEHLGVISQGLSFEVRSLVLDQHATFSLQKMVESPLYDEESMGLIRAFLINLPSSSQQQSGDLLNQVKPDDIGFFLKAATDKHGAMFLTVLCRASSENDFLLLVNLMLSSIVRIANDRFGNYVVQKALARAENMNDGGLMTDYILNALLPEDTMLAMAQDEFGVKVLLTCLGHSDEIFDRVVAGIFADEGGPVCLRSFVPSTLMCNVHASTLLKRAMRTDRDPQRKAQHLQLLWSLLEPLVPNMLVQDYEKWRHFLQNM